MAAIEVINFVIEAPKQTPSSSISESLLHDPIPKPLEYDNDPIQDFCKYEMIWRRLRTNA